MTLFTVAPVQPWENPPLPTGRLLRKCSGCGKRRQCATCVSCDERYCSECSHRLKPPKDESWICDGCADEAREFATYGIWGPP